MSLIRFQAIFLTSHRRIFRNHLNEEIEKVTKISALIVDSWIFLLLYILIGFVNQKTCQFFSWIRLHHRSSITYQCISAFCQSMEIFERLRNSLLCSSFNKKNSSEISARIGSIQIPIGCKRHSRQVATSYWSLSYFL